MTSPALPARAHLRSLADDLFAMAFVGIALGVALVVLPELLAVALCP